MKSACSVGLDRDGEKTCRTCAMGMLVSWWIDELNSKGFKDQAAQVEKVALDEGKAPEDICKVMDTIPDQVDEPMRTRLNELNEVFDHHATEEEKADKPAKAEEEA